MTTVQLDEIPTVTVTLDVLTGRNVTRYVLDVSTGNSFTCLRTKFYTFLTVDYWKFTI